mmetsp:Transcript_23616/g.33836  ORF Transcript_23616/g.33836 Transcript_23616/m.33836 type:complete len:98 (-) Transcript_23616:59-352(-)
MGKPTPIHIVIVIGAIPVCRAENKGRWAFYARSFKTCRSATATPCAVSHEKGYFSAASGFNKISYTQVYPELFPNNGGSANGNIINSGSQFLTIDSI